MTWIHKVFRHWNCCCSLILWLSSFGIVENWVSDRESHFKNDSRKLLKYNQRTSHHFKFAYSPSLNGIVEVVCRELLRAIRAIFSEFLLPYQAWPSLMPLVQSAPSNSVLSRLGNICPLTVSSRVPSNSPLNTIRKTISDVGSVQSIEVVRLRQTMNIDKLKDSINKLHQNVAEEFNKKRRAAVEVHNRKTNFKPINFDVVG